ncbi:hypothetical protein [Pseudomonas guariconensis]|uniref:hypothetical protein n=1 Tax=Pseudomonas guariconensis TaxID=1288410 RepID=UPI0018A9F889|nr:hypothetical protein [Pseudomonas guariconensis]MBF8756176.1 hypothetical protein [Pseudomonas guariconensis]
MFMWMKRTSWKEEAANIPKYSYNSKIEHVLCQWEKLAVERKKFLVYWVSLDKFEGSLLSKRNAEDVFNECDVFPTSLIDIKRPLLKQHNYKVSNNESAGTTFGEVALVLEVPPQNILGVLQLKGAGSVTFFANDHELYDPVNEYLRLGWIEMLKKARVLVSPDKVFGGHRYCNDVLVVGRPGLEINGVVTRRVKVAGLICAREYVSNGLKDGGGARMLILSRLRKYNPTLNVTVV